MYSRRVLQQFQNTRNAGELPDADAYAQVHNPACGDVLHLAVKVAHGRISEAKFRARGCVSAIACASQLTDMLQDKTLAEARTLRREDIVNALGGLPETSIHASHLAMDALAQILRELGADRRSKPRG